jgi:hypothetical protein
MTSAFGCAKECGSSTIILPIRFSVSHAADEGLCVAAVRRMLLGDRGEMQLLQGFNRLIGRRGR